MKVKVIRYIRPLAIFKDCMSASNLGGIALLFAIDQEATTLDVAFSICDDTDNFDRAIADKYVHMRYGSHENIISFPYDRSKSLVDNLIDHLDNFDLSGNREASTLRRKLKQYINDNMTIDDIYRQSHSNTQCGHR